MIVSVHTPPSPNLPFVYLLAQMMFNGYNPLHSELRSSMSGDWSLKMYTLWPRFAKIYLLCFRNLVVYWLTVVIVFIRLSLSVYLFAPSLPSTPNTLQTCQVVCKESVDRKGLYYVTDYYSTLAEELLPLKRGSRCGLHPRCLRGFEGLDLAVLTSLSQLLTFYLTLCYFASTSVSLRLCQSVCLFCLSLSRSLALLSGIMVYYCVQWLNPMKPCVPSLGCSVILLLISVFERFYAINLFKLVQLVKGSYSSKNERNLTDFPEWQQYISLIHNLTT